MYVQLREKYTNLLQKTRNHDATFPIFFFLVLSNIDLTSMSFNLIWWFGTIIDWESRNVFCYCQYVENIKVDFMEILWIFCFLNVIEEVREFLETMPFPLFIHSTANKFCFRSTMTVFNIWHFIFSIFMPLFYRAIKYYKPVTFFIKSRDNYWSFLFRFKDIIHDLWSTSTYTDMTQTRDTAKS